MSPLRLLITDIRFRFPVILFWLILILSVKTMAQPIWKLEIDGKVEDNGKALEGAQIKILKGGSEKASLFSGSNGKFKYALEPNNDYTISVTKPGGYITKLIFISTKNVPSSEDTRDGFQPFKMEINIFKEMLGLDVSILKQPVGKIFYDESANNFQFDKAYTQSILAELEKLTEDLAKKLAEEAAAAAEAQKKKMEFDKLINQGDATLNAKNLEKALEIFTKALDLQVDNALANAKIANVNKLRAEEEAKKKLEEEAKKKAEADAAAKAEAAKKKAEFDKKLADGDAALSKKKFDEALSAYQAALALNFDNATANSKIAGAQKAKADEEARLKAEEEAKKKADADAAAKAEAAKKKEDFDKKIADGDAALTKRKFDEALTAFQSALALNFDNTTANSRIAGAQKAKAEEEARIKAEEEAKKKADADAAAKAEAAKKKAEFDKKISEGDAALSKKKFDEALTSFQAALAMNVDNASAEARLKTLEDARKAEQDAAAKAELDKKKSAFDKLISEGDAALSKKKFDDALASFQQALSMAFDNPTAESRIKAANDAKKSELDAQAKAELDKKKVEFDKFISEGDLELGKTKFDDAISQYQKALALNVDNTAAEQKIKSAGEAKKKVEEETKNKEETARKKAEFDKKILEGDAALSKKKFDEALSAFQSALAMNVDNAAAEARIKSVSDAQKLEQDAAAKAEQEKKKAEFDKKILEGDAALSKKKFDEALSAFQSALAMNVDNAAAEARIKSVSDAQKLEQDAAAKAEQEKKKAEFDKKILEGDAALSKKKFDEALSAFQSALAMNVDNATADSKMKELERLRLAEEDARKKAEDEEKNKAEAARKRAEFEALIKEGDDLLSAVAYDQAVIRYQAALNTGFDNQFAEKKIAEAQKAKKDAEDARLKQEAAQKRESFDKLISEGDREMEKKNFSDAINRFQAALDLHVDDSMAGTKLAAAKDALAAYEMARKEADEKSKKLRQFDLAMEVGEQMIKDKRFEDALSSFESALTMHIDDPRVNARIAEVKKEIEKDEARRKADEAARLKEESDRKKAEFDQLISKGDKKAAEKSWEAALFEYTQALNLKVDDNLANAKIKAIEDARGKEDEAKRLAEEAERKKADESKRKEDFENLLKMAREQIKSSAFDAASSTLSDARSLNIDNERVKQIQAELDRARAEDDARRKKEDEARSKADAERRAADFENLISQGDRELVSNSFDVAITSYKMALDLHINDPLATQKIADAEKARKEYEAKLAAEEEKRRIREEEERLKRDAVQRKIDFEKRIKEGDQAILSRLFDAAVEAYSAALELHVQDPLAQKKLDDAIKKRDEAERKKREKEEEIARLAEEARKKREELERVRLEQEAKRKGIDEDLAKRRAEAAERERLFRERVKLENEKRQEELRKKIEAQKAALAHYGGPAKPKPALENQAPKDPVTKAPSRYDLAKKYSQGVTQEEIEGSNCTITRVVVVKGKVGDEYKKIRYNWGQIVFKKNDRDISESIFNTETTKR
jgi:tetratricopeptide (TPR) repeat protein